MTGVQTCALPISPDDPFFAATDAEIEELFTGALGRIFPGFRRRDVAAFRVSRVRQVMALPTLDYSARLPPVTTSVPGLHLASSAHIVNGTLNVNETVDLAERTAESLLAAERALDPAGPLDRARSAPAVAAEPAGAPAAGWHGRRRARAAP